MGMVRTPEEIAAMQRAMANPRFLNSEMLAVEFLTTAETARRLLPPGLEPLEEPSVTISIGRWQSDCVGDFEGGNVYLACRAGEIEGAYAVAMYMDSDSSISFGRDVFGEPKKQGRMFMHRQGTRMAGGIERHGVRLIELEGDLVDDDGPTRGRRARFNVKARPAADGQGLEEDAVLTVADFDLDFSVSRSGPGSVRLAGTVHDPLDEIEVVEARRATYVEGDLSARARTLARIPAAEFLPYALGRLDYWPALDSAGRDQAESA